MASRGRGRDPAAVADAAWRWFMTTEDAEAIPSPARSVADDASVVNGDERVELDSLAGTPAVLRTDGARSRLGMGGPTSREGVVRDGLDDSRLAREEAVALQRAVDESIRGDGPTASAPSTRPSPPTAATTPPPGPSPESSPPVSRAASMAASLTPRMPVSLSSSLTSPSTAGADESRRLRELLALANESIAEHARQKERLLALVKRQGAIVESKTAEAETLASRLRKAEGQLVAEAESRTALETRLARAESERGEFSRRVQALESARAAMEAELSQRVGALADVRRDAEEARRREATESARADRLSLERAEWQRGLDETRRRMEEDRVAHRALVESLAGALVAVQRRLRQVDQVDDAEEAEAGDEIGPGAAGAAGAAGGRVSRGRLRDADESGFSASRSRVDSWSRGPLRARPASPTQTQTPPRGRHRVGVSPARDGVAYSDVHSPDSIDNENEALEGEGAASLGAEDRSDEGLGVVPVEDLSSDSSDTARTPMTGEGCLTLLAELGRMVARLDVRARGRGDRRRRVRQEQALLLDEVLAQRQRADVAERESVEAVRRAQAAQAALAEARARWDDARREIEATVQARADADRRVLEQRMREAVDEGERARSALAAAHTDHRRALLAEQEAIARAERAEAEAADAQARLEQAHAALTDARRLADSATDDRSRAREELSRKALEAADAQAACRLAQTALAAANQEVTSLRSEVRDRMRQASAAHDAALAAESALASERGARSQVEERRRQLAAEVEELGRRERAATRRAEQLGAENDSLRSEVERLRPLGAQLREEESALAAIRRQVDELGAEQAQLARERDEAVLSVQAWRSRAEEAELQCEALERRRKDELGREQSERERETRRLRHELVLAQQALDAELRTQRNVDAEIQVLRRQADDARDQIVAKEATIAHLQRELYAIRRAGVEASLATLPKVRSSSAVEDGKGLVEGLAAATRAPPLPAPVVVDRAMRREGEQKEDEGLRSASTSTNVSAATVSAATASTATAGRFSRVDPVLRVASSEVRPRLAETASVAVEATPRVDGTARPRSLFDLAASDSRLSSPSAGVPSDPIEAARLASRLRRTERERR